MQRLTEREVETADKLRVEKLKQTMDALTEKEKFSSNGFWKLKKAIAKKKSSPKINIFSVILFWYKQREYVRYLNCTYIRI